MIDDFARVTKAKRPTLGVGQDRVLRNALGDVSPALLASISEHEGAFRRMAWNIRTAREAYDANPGRETKRKYVGAMVALAKWIANVRNYGSRYPRRGRRRPR